MKLLSTERDMTYVVEPDLELDLRDVMLDLDPGMLAWTPPTR